jgi:hypothetical protein
MQKHVVDADAIQHEAAEVEVETGRPAPRRTRAKAAPAAEAGAEALGFAAEAPVSGDASQADLALEPAAADDAPARHDDAARLVDAAVTAATEALSLADAPTGEAAEAAPAEAEAEAAPAVAPVEAAPEVARAEAVEVAEAVAPAVEAVETQAPAEEAAADAGGVRRTALGFAFAFGPEHLTSLRVGDWSKGGARLALAGSEAAAGLSVAQIEAALRVVQAQRRTAAALRERTRAFWPRLPDVAAADLAGATAESVLETALASARATQARVAELRRAD